MKEPSYIEESDELLLLRKYHTAESLQLQKGHADLGFILLRNTLFTCYGHTQFSHLVENSGLHDESINFSKAMRAVADNERWSISTTYAAFRALRKILEKTNISPSFITKISIPKKERGKTLLSKKYQATISNESDKIALDEIIQLTKSKTRMKSDSSIRIFLSFVVNLLKKHEISITKYRDIASVPYDDIRKSIVDMKQAKLFRTHLHYAMVFICNVLEHQEYMKQFEAGKRAIEKKFGIKEDNDVHRISKEELEAMYEATRDDVKLRAIFLTMVSTGMRTIGVSNIRLENVCTIVNNNVIINKVGRTIEKGNKWLTFPISELLSETLHSYITTTRKSNSSYLFSSSKGTNVSPNSISASIKKIARLAGLNGRHIHAHSIRHSFAHILLETGNRPEMVSKMLGHSSTSTTEYYYLKESAADASKRMNIPWLARQDNYNPVPDFLQAKTNHKKSRTNAALEAIIRDFTKYETK